MQIVQNYANFIGGDLHVLGGSIIRKDGTLNTLYPPGPRYRFNVLGTCWITGSGTQDLLRNAQQFSERYGDEDLPPDGVAAHWFAIDTNAVRLAEEINGRVGTWGGYVEHAYLNAEEHRWVRGPRALHLFLRAERLDRDMVGLRNIPRMVAYDPGPETGRLLSVLFEPVAARMNFALRNLPGDYAHSNIPPDGFWENWRPEVTTVTVILNDELNPPSFINHTMGSHLSELVDFDLNEDGPYYSIAREVRNHLGRCVAEAWGRKYEDE